MSHGEGGDMIDGTVPKMSRNVQVSSVFAYQVTYSFHYAKLTRSVQLGHVVDLQHINLSRISSEISYKHEKYQKLIFTRQFTTNWAKKFFISFLSLHSTFGPWGKI